nr:hypothetical protein BaRGS_014624 [Batillaria attramentaria]
MNFTSRSEKNGPNRQPSFTYHPNPVPVDENVAPGTSLFSFDVTDDVDNFNDVISLTSWTVDPLADEGLFEFDDAAFTVKLASGQSFDYETKTTEFLITCVVTDGYLFSTGTVTITILDTNEPPYFDSDPVITTAEEGEASTISFLPPYNAHDPDGDTLTFDLVPGVLSADLFAINTATGQLTNVVELDRDLDAPDSVSVQVTASDGEYTVTATVTIYLEDVNDNKPKFNQSSYEFKNEGPDIVNLPSEAYIHEDAIRMQLFPLDVVDPESDQYVCEKFDLVPPSASFLVEDRTGNNDFKVYYTGNGKLSAANKPKYELTVRCYDSNAEVKKTLTIIIQPNLAPLLECPKTITVNALNTAEDGEVHTISASDDENDVLEYEVSPTTDFYVGAYSGVIRAKKSLRAAETDQYAVEVSVSDGKNDEVSCRYVILLTNLNQAPVFTNLDRTVEVPEHTPSGTALYVISVNDPNIFGPNIDITWTSPDKNKFDVEVSGLTATLKLVEGYELDYESNDKTYTFTFVASDTYLTSEETSLTLQVTPINEPPYFVHGDVYYATFSEFHDPPESVAIGCQIRDPDEDDEVTYGVSGPNSDLFAIENCVMTLASEYDLDSGLANPVTFELTGTDKLGEVATASLIVTITEINDNTPEFEGPVTLTIERGMVAGDPIGAAKAVDLDSGTDGAISYSIVSDPENPDEADKYITFLSSGKFVLRQSMDDVIASGENFQYVVMATDYGSPSRSSTTTVNVVYDPFPNITTTEASTTTTEALEDSGDVWTNPLFIDEVPRQPDRIVSAFKASSRLWRTQVEVTQYDYDNNNNKKDRENH